VATSTRTPLVGEEFLEDDSQMLFAGTNITPQRLRTPTAAAAANRYGMQQHHHDGGIGGIGGSSSIMPGDSTIATTPNSCTYSTSPGPAYSSLGGNTNGIDDVTEDDHDAFPFPMLRLGQNADAAVDATAAADLDAILVRKSAAAVAAVVDKDNAGAIPGSAIMDGKYAEEEDDDSDTPLITDKGSSASSSKSRWKGRRRRRMRLTK